MNISEKILGKIAACTIGDGGYQHAMFGISFTLEGRGCDCGDFWGAWGPGITWSSSCKWTEAERQQQIANAFWRLAKLMRQAKVKDAKELVGIPVEITFERGILKEWRLLDEVL